MVSMYRCETQAWGPASHSWWQPNQTTSQHQSHRSAHCHPPLRPGYQGLLLYCKLAAQQGLA
jgi:hypothetical protein